MFIDFVSFGSKLRQACFSDFHGVVLGFGFGGLGRVGMLADCGCPLVEYCRVGGVLAYGGICCVDLWGLVYGGVCCVDLWVLPRLLGACGVSGWCRVDII